MYGVTGVCSLLTRHAPASSKSDAATTPPAEPRPLPSPALSTKTVPPNPNVTAFAQKLRMHDVDFSGKRVVMRVDYNVPIHNGVVTDETRIVATLDSLRHLLAATGPKGGVRCVVLLAHLGQPNAADFVRDEFTLRPCVAVLQKHLPGVPVQFVDDCVGPQLEETIRTCAPGTVILTENVRFHIEETGSAVGRDGKKLKASPQAVAAFYEQLTRLGDVYVMEAFGAAHRPHASIVGVQLPVRVPGLLVARELSFYERVLTSPQRPVLCVLGGAKVSDKIKLIERLLELSDEMFIAGGMAYTFKRVLQGMPIGKSLFDEAGAQHVPKIMALAQEKGVKLHFPIDHVIADKFAADAKLGLVADAHGVPKEWMALDMGPQSCALLSTVVKRARTVLWNGPVGVYEMGPFCIGTLSAMADVAEATTRGAVTVIGGGDTAAAAGALHYGDRPVAECVSWVSTGGGASLTLLEGELLPGVRVLSDKSPAPEQPLPLPQPKAEPAVKAAREAANIVA